MRGMLLMENSGLSAQLLLAACQLPGPCLWACLGRDDELCTSCAGLSQLHVGRAPTEPVMLCSANTA